MTICIASVCTHNNKEVFVIATDHMIDVGIGQFEHDIKKHKKLNGKSIAMLSGNSLIFNDLVKDIKKGSLFKEIKEKIYSNFVALKKDWINKQLLSKFGLNENEIKEIIKSELKNQFIAKLVEQIAKFELRTSILLVGFEDSKTQIAEIGEHGYADFSDIHFHAIGSGQLQAVNTLLFQKQSKDNNLRTTIYNVFKAKSNAEVSSGVGIETDMLILTQDRCHDLTKEDLDTLSKIYKEELQRGRNSIDLNNLKILNTLQR